MVGEDTTAPAGQVTYVGHATALVELDGVRILTDPVLRPRVLHLRRRGAVDVGALRDLDAVLVSHAHWDHLDVPSLRRLGRDVRIVIPRGAGTLLGRRRFTDVVEVDVGDRVEIGRLTVTATRAEHDAGRGPFGVKSPALGYLIEASWRVYFAGDTDLFDELAELAPLDLALLPVAGWGSSLPPGHLDPRRAAEALRLLEPRIAVPIHWGTYSTITSRKRPPGLERAPAAEFLRRAASLAPAVDVRVLDLGETLVLD